MGRLENPRMKPVALIDADRRALALRGLYKCLTENYDNGADRLGVTDRQLQALQDAADDAESYSLDMRRRLDSNA